MAEVSSLKTSGNDTMRDLSRLGSVSLLAEEDYGCDRKALTTINARLF